MLQLMAADHVRHMLLNLGSVDGAKNSDAPPVANPPASEAAAAPERVASKPAEQVRPYQ